MAQMQARVRRLPPNQQELRRPLTMNGYNFTERVRKVLAVAREEAERLRHEYVGTEHILLGLIVEGEGVAATVLQNLEIDCDELRFDIESVVKKGRGGPPGPDLPYTSRGKKVLELAMTEARELHHEYVGTEHVLLGLIREGAGIGAQVLVDRGVTLDKARAETLRVLGTESVETSKRLRQPRNRATANDSMFAVAQPEVAERVRDVLREADDVATEFQAAALMPIHVAIALVRNGEGFANAILDRLNVDRAEIVRALTSEARNIEPPVVLEPRLNYSQFMVAFMRQVESESRWRHSPPTTLNVLLTLLDTVLYFGLIFLAHGDYDGRVGAVRRRLRG
jgi:ATP-dependent Clp protease ATP-binding subunit ClpA